MPSVPIIDPHIKASIERYECEGCCGFVARVSVNDVFTNVVHGESAEALGFDEAVHRRLARITAEYVAKRVEEAVLATKPTVDPPDDDQPRPPRR